MISLVKVLNERVYLVCKKDLYFYIKKINCDLQSLNKQMKDKDIEFDAIIQSGSNGGAFVVFPYDIKREFGKGRLKVHAKFDGISYSGSIVNMGLKNDDGTICYILGILKSIRHDIGKHIGDSVHVVVNLIDV